MATSRLQLLSKKLVKPSSPTPHLLQHYKLSLMDQLLTGKYTPIALFYPNQCYNRSPDHTIPTSFLLEKSLSKLLTSYHPFAGRLVDNISIDCNDMGATSMEARVKCPMSEILKEPHANVENTLFPSGLPWADSYEKGSLVVAQLTHFDCGGKALSLCLSHKLGDGATLINFLSDWAAMARQSAETPCPHFNGTSLYPPIDDSLTQPIYELEQQHHIATRVAFSASNLNHLKAVVAAKSGVHKPTRVEVVTALLVTKCALAASMVNLEYSFKPFVLLTPVNLRPLLMPPLPPSSVGNIVSLLPTSFVDKGEMKLSRFVSKLRQAKVELFEKYKGMKQNELVSAVLEEKEELLAGKDEFDTYRMTSLCNYPLYNLDFGWGRPIRVTLGSMPTKNSFILIDDQNGDGVEAILSLDEQVMSRFESEQEILDFASLHPTT